MRRSLPRSRRSLRSERNDWSRDTQQVAGHDLAMNWGYQGGEGDDSQIAIDSLGKGGGAASRKEFHVRNVCLESGRHHCGGSGRWSGQGSREVWRTGGALRIVGAGGL